MLLRRSSCDGIGIHLHFIDLKRAATSEEVLPLACGINEGLGKVGGASIVPSIKGHLHILAK